MRPFLSLVVSSFFLFAVSGCMVLDEVDNANAQMNSRSKKRIAAKAGTTDAESSAGSANQPLLEDSKRWWKEATSLAPKAVDSSIVKCRLGSGIEFRSRDDCLSRGGVPQGVSS